MNGMLGGLDGEAEEVETGFGLQKDGSAIKVR